MIREDVIQEFARPWASPVVLVRKNDSSLRFCVDCRRLGAVTHKDMFPLSRIDDLMNQMQGNKIFSPHTSCQARLLEDQRQGRVKQENSFGTM